MPRQPLTPNRHTALSSPPAGTKIRLPLKSPDVPTNIVLGDFPEFFGAFAIEGQFEYSLSLDSHPSGSFSFRIQAERKEELKNILRENTELTAFGVGFAVESLNFTEVPAAQDPSRVILVSVNLRGKWQFYADKLTPLQKSRSVAPGQQDPECQQEADAGSVKRLAYLTCQELANRVGAAFVAPGRWWVRIPRETLPSEGITLGGALDERKAINKCFLDWNNPDTIRGRRFDETPHRRIEEIDIWSEVTSTFSGSYPCPQKLQLPNGRLYPDTSDEPLPPAPLLPTPPTIKRENPWPLSKRYHPRYRLDGQFVQEAKSEQVKERRKDETPRWRQKPWLEYVLEEGDLDPTKPLDPDGFVKTVEVSHNDKKVIRRTSYKNNTPVKVEEKIYAIEIYGDQLYYYHVNDNEWRTYTTPAGAYWTLIEETTTINEYEPRYGFYIGKTTTGRTRVRFRDESGSPPETALIFMLNTGTILEDLVDDEDPNKLISLISKIFQEISGEDIHYIETNKNPDSGFLSQALYQMDPLYRWQWMPIRREECRILEPKSKYFPDAEESEAAGEKKCLPNGQSAYKREEDPSYAPPYFASKIINISSGHLTYPNPEWQLRDEIWTRLNRNFYPGQDWYPKSPIAPILETGKLTKEEQTIEVLPAGSSVQSIYTPNTARTEAIDIYTTYTHRYEAKEAGYGMMLQEASFSRSTGQPPDAERLAQEWEQIPADESDKKAKEPKEFVWYVKTPVPDCAEEPFIESAGYVPATTKGSYSRELEGGSLNYSTAETLQEAKDAAWFSLFLENIQGMGTEEFSVKFNPDYRPGDRITRTINGWQGDRIVTAVRHSLVIEGLWQSRPIVTGITRLTLAPVPDIQLEFKRERLPENEPEEDKTPRDRQIGNLGTIDCKLGNLYTRYSK